MKIDGGLGFHPSGTGAAAREAEEVGYDGVWSAETGHDPFVPLAVAAEATQHLELATGIAVAFARNPMNLAMLANDLQLLSKGRFLLGLGSQIKAHITKRYSMPWSHPAPRMREMISAIRAIWASWHTAEPLGFRGEFYTHTLMTPFFNPGPNPFGHPPILLAAVGPVMAEVAGEVADGTITWCTGPVTLREQIVPFITQAAGRAGRSAPEVVVALPVCVTDDPDAARARAARVFQIYGRLPSYRAMLDKEGVAGPADVAIVGDEDSVASQIAALAEYGVTDFVAGEFARGPERQRTRDLLKTLIAG